MRERFVPAFDITPEVLTHTQALDLKAVGIVANGVTSGCDFGREVEGLYVRAMLSAQKEVNEIPLTWYFLHEEPERRLWSVNPSVMYLEGEKGEAVVSIVSGWRSSSRTGAASYSTATSRGYTGQRTGRVHDLRGVFGEDRAHLRG